jgi:hypothetical protein
MASRRQGGSSPINSIHRPFGAGTSDASASPSAQPSALTALARLLGRQAGRHFHKNRYEGLGRVQLILVERDGVFLVESRV